MPSEQNARNHDSKTLKELESKHVEEAAVSISEQSKTEVLNDGEAPKVVDVVDEEKRMAATLLQKRFAQFLEVWVSHGLKEGLKRTTLVRSADAAWRLTYMVDLEAFDRYLNSGGQAYTLGSGRNKHPPNVAGNGVMFTVHTKSTITVTRVTMQPGPTYKYQGKPVEGKMCLYSTLRPLRHACDHDQHWTKQADNFGKSQSNGGNCLELRSGGLTIQSSSSMTFYLHSPVSNRVSAHVLEPVKKTVACDDHITMQPGIVTHCTGLIEPGFVCDTKVAACLKLEYELGS
jgi:hypothetical protein